MWVYKILNGLGRFWHTKMIKRYINSIELQDPSHYLLPSGKKLPVFLGDGMGDFEKRDSSADKKVVQNYIEHCKEQIYTATKYLEELESEEKRID